MANLINEIIWHQFGASIDSLKKAIDACPEDIWSDRAPYHEFWYVTYHTLFWLDYYLSDPAAEFSPPPPYTLGEMDPAGVLPDRVYTKEEMLTYLAHGRTKCKETIAAMTEEKAQQGCGFERLDFSVAELHLYTMRHVQHHTAQLNMILRLRTNSAPGWTFRAS